MYVCISINQSNNALLVSIIYTDKQILLSANLGNGVFVNVNIYCNIM